jgi:hypothetical protein
MTPALSSASALNSGHVTKRSKMESTGEFSEVQEWLKCVVVSKSLHGMYLQLWIAFR